MRKLIVFILIAAGLLLAVPAAALAVTPPPGSTDNGITDANFGLAGYYVESGADFTSVTATWTVPAVTGGDEADFYVELGEWSAGTYCTPSGAPSGYAGNNSHPLNAGDRVTATVSASPDGSGEWLYSASLDDLTNSANSAPPWQGASTYAPNYPAVLVDNGGDVLSNFGTVVFSNCAVNGKAISSFSAYRRADMTDSSVGPQAYVGALNSSGNSFSVYYSTVPRLVHVTPASGPVGSTVVLAGSGLAYASKVTFNGLSAAFSVVDDKYIACLVPSGAKSGPVVVTLSNGQTATSTFTVAAASAPANSALPAISGTAVVGKTLTCSSGTWTGSTPITYTYQWLRNGVAISGATASTHVVTTADLLKTLSCKVTAKNSAGSAAATSKGVAIVPKLTLKASATSLKKGSKVTLSGTVANATSAVRSLTIARSVSGKLTTLKTLTLTTSNTFSWAYQPTATGSWVFVATYKVGTTTYKSNTVTVTVHS